MVKQRFREFWESRKSINEAIFYKPNKSHSHIYLIEEVGFLGEHCEGMYVSGSYNCRDGSMTVNFYVKNIGAVRRFCLGGPEHGTLGRFHEHILEKDSDAYAENNLPVAIARPDLEGLAPEQAWRMICAEAKVSHTDRYNDPQEWCR